MRQCNAKKLKSLPKTIKSMALNERDKTLKFLGHEKYHCSVEPFIKHLCAAMQRRKCEPLIAVYDVIKALKVDGDDSAVRRLITCAAVDLQFGECNRATQLLEYPEFQKVVRPLDDSGRHAVLTETAI